MSRMKQLPVELIQLFTQYIHDKPSLMLVNKRFYAACLPQLYYSFQLQNSCPHLPLVRELKWIVNSTTIQLVPQLLKMHIKKLIIEHGVDYQEEWFIQIQQVIRSLPLIALEYEEGLIRYCILPSTLQYIRMNNFIEHVKLDYVLPSNVWYVNMSSMGGFEFGQIVYTHVKHLDLSGYDLRNIQRIADHMPNLETLSIEGLHNGPLDLDGFPKLQHFMSNVLPRRLPLCITRLEVTSIQWNEIPDIVLPKTLQHVIFFVPFSTLLESPNMLFRIVHMVEHIAKWTVGGWEFALDSIVISNTSTFPPSSTWASLNLDRMKKVRLIENGYRVLVTANQHNLASMLDILDYFKLEFQTHLGRPLDDYIRMLLLED